MRGRGEMMGREGDRERERERGGRERETRERKIERGGRRVIIPQLCTS